MSAHKSIVWKSFEKETEKKVRCKICSCLLSYNGSTGTMLNHLKGKHPIVMNSDENMSCQSKLTTFVGQKKMDAARAKKITDLIVGMVVKDLLPISVVENCGFKELMGFLEPEYVLPCRKTIKERIMQLHASVKENLKSELSDSTAVALTADCWTSLSTESYMTVTAHFLKNSFSQTLKTIVLQTSAFPERHTAENLANELLRLTSEWNISGKVVAIVHDNAANMNAATALTQFQKVNCAAHTLQLAISDGLKNVREITKVIAAASKLVGHFKHSSVATQGLMKKQREMNLKELKLKQKCETRWNSVFEMFERLCMNRWPVTAVLSDRVLTKQPDARSLELKDSWWELMGEMCPILKPFQMATTVLSEEENSSFSVVLPVIRGLNVRHLVVQDGDSKYASEFKMAVEKSLNDRFPSCDGSTTGQRISLLASALDPRHKHLKFTSESEKEVAKELLSSLFLEESREPAAKRRREEADRRRPSDADNAFSVLLGENYSHYGDSLANNELERYFSDPCILPNENPLEWWAKNEDRFPVVASIARKYLVIPATSVPAERIFSKAGQIVSKKRCRLQASTVDALIFLNKNL